MVITKSGVTVMKINGYEFPNLPAPFTDEETVDIKHFIVGYIEAIFFTEDEEIGESGAGELSYEAKHSIVNDCAAFYLANKQDLKAVSTDYTYHIGNTGEDFWLTRNAHGVGFWSRGLGDEGRNLTDACGWGTDFAEKYVYRGDDNLIYIQ